MWRLKYECEVADIVQLRVPKVYRVKGICKDIEIEIEFHEEVVEAPKKNTKIIVEITEDREKCLNHYFCGHGYVVSNIYLGDIYRVVISLHGFLVVIRAPQKIELNVMDKVYVGVTF